MRDVVFLAIVAAFFVVASLYVRGCAAVVGSSTELAADAGEDADEVTA